MGVLTLLWLPGLQYPITSDTSVYALLGESVWRHGTFALGGVPYAKQLPLHAILSYPLSWLLTFQLGMKVSSLLAGCAVLVTTFFLFHRSFSSSTGLLAVLFLLFHHGFVLMTMLGSADLLFTALFLGSLIAFDRAEAHPCQYLLAGLLLGLACLTRYNGIILFGLYPLYLLWKRPRDLRLPFFWASMAVAAGLFGLWFFRNFLVFGNPLYTTYASEFQEQVPSVFVEVLENIRYYVNPLHNVLPILLVLSLYGLWRFGGRRPLLVLGMLAGMFFALLWWVKGMRFAFPGYPVLLGFAAAGVGDLWSRMKALRSIFVVVAVCTVILHASVLCLYTYGACNAWFDQTIGHIPPDLGLSSEGLYGISLARDFINEHALRDAAVLVDSVNTATWRNGIFRDDLRIVRDLSEACPAYKIEQSVFSSTPLFVTESSPKTGVVLRGCPTAKP
jgi:4-amino-4-deoxy-L-arabinose transferase-like glycosyltransferase